MQIYRIEEMTWPDIEAAITGGRNTLIIPIASIEQHGPHLPLITDTLLGEALGERVAAELGDALVAPVIRPGCSDHHLAFAGSLSISEKLLTDMVEAYCTCFSRYGFKHIVLMPTHGGNFSPIAKVGNSLKAEYNEKGINIITLANLEDLIASIAEPLYSYGYSFEQVGGHAGAGETALVMALRPDLVHENRFQEGFVGKLNIPKLLKGSLKEITEIGVLGDPRGSTAEMGHKILASVVMKYTGLIREKRRIHVKM